MAKPPGRCLVKGQGRQPRKFARQSYTYAFKLAVINYHRTSKSISATVLFFCPDVPGSMRNPKRKLVYKWEKKRQLVEVVAGNARRTAHHRVRKPGLGTTLSGDAEAQIIKWVNDYRRDGAPVSPLMLQLKAKEVAAAHGITADVFVGSWHWQRGFTRRHRFSSRAKTHQGQTTPAEAMEKAAAFAKEVAAKATAEGISIIYNADQTGVNFELLPRKTLSARGAKTVWVKCGEKEKERMTAMLLGDSTGRTYPLFLVMKTKASKVENVRIENARQRHGFGRRLWDEIEPLQDAHNVRIYGNESAWWTGVLTVEFLRFHFGHRTVFSEPVMLLLDDFSGHWVTDVKEYAVMVNVVLVKVPPSLTWLCQPADAVWIKPVKDRLRRYWVKHLQQQLAAHKERQGDAPYDMTAPNRGTVASWISRAWDDIKESIIQAGFRKCLVDACSADPASFEHDEPAEMQTAIDSVVDGLERLHLVDSVSSIADNDDVVNSTTE